MSGIAGVDGASISVPYLALPCLPSLHRNNVVLDTSFSIRFDFCDCDCSWYFFTCVTSRVVAMGWRFI